MERWGQVSQRCSRRECEERKYRQSRAFDRLPLHPDWSWGKGSFGEVWLGIGRQTEGSWVRFFPWQRNGSVWYAVEGVNRQRARGDDGQKKVLEEQGRGWGGQMI